jgi:hypothetical protein
MTPAYFNISAFISCVWLPIGQLDPDGANSRVRPYLALCAPGCNKKSLSLMGEALARNRGYGFGVAVAGAGGAGVG